MTRFSLLPRPLWFDRRALAFCAGGAILFSTAALCAQDPAVVGRWVEPPGADFYDNEHFTPGDYGGTPWDIRVEYAVLLHTGDVLVWRGVGKWLWDPQTGDATDVTDTQFPVGVCTSHAALADGAILLAGGGNICANAIDDVQIYDPTGGAQGPWFGAASLPEDRRYPTLTPLPDGTMLVTGGCIDPGPPQVFGGPAIYEDDSQGGFWTSVSMSDPLPASVRNYPHMHVIPSGQIAFAGPHHNTKILDIDAGEWINVQNVGWPGAFRPTANFGPGKLILAGGPMEQTITEEVLETTNRTALIDFDIPNPQNAL